MAKNSLEGAAACSYVAAADCVVVTSSNFTLDMQGDMFSDKVDKLLMPMGCNSLQLKL
jgi:hypothetical protein